MRRYTAGSGLPGSRYSTTGAEHNERMQPTRMRPIIHRSENNTDVIAGLQRAPRPTEPLQDGRSTGHQAPLLRRAPTIGQWPSPMPHFVVGPPYPVPSFISNNPGQRNGPLRTRRHAQSASPAGILIRRIGHPHAMHPLFEPM